MFNAKAERTYVLSKVDWFEKETRRRCVYVRTFVALFEVHQTDEACDALLLFNIDGYAMVKIGKFAEIPDVRDASISEKINVNHKS